MDNVGNHRVQPIRPRAAAVAMLLSLTLAPALMAEIRDHRQEIAEASAQYRARLFPDGHMPPKHDWRRQRPVLPGERKPPVAPGGVGYGYYFYDGAMLWTNSTVADYYLVAPNSLGQSVSYLYLTSTCRAQLGTESLIAYSGVNEAAFWIYDWAQAATAPWQVMMDLPVAHPQYLTQRPDEFGVTQQMVHVRNGTFSLGVANGQFQWQNRVWLFDFSRGDWDLIYAYSYGTANLSDNTYQNADAVGFWGPIVETFDAYTNYTEIQPVGFDLIRLFQDANPNPFWLNTTNSYAVKSMPWQLLAEAPDTSFTVAVNATLPPGGAFGTGTLCVTANTHAGSFSVSPSNGTAASGWVTTPWSNRWDKIMVALPPGDYSINFSDLPGLATPSPQPFTIVSNNIATVQADYTLPPDFLGVTSAGRSIIMSWNASTGLVYQLQYATNLSLANWLNVGNAITASNSVLSATDSFNSDLERYYRVQQQ